MGIVEKQKAESRKQKAESGKPKAESRKQKAESRKRKAESRKPKAEIKTLDLSTVKRGTWNVERLGRVVAAVMLGVV